MLFMLMCCKDKDTIRVYNVHLESLKINPGKEEISKENSEKLKIRLENAFKIQANQVDLILHHQENPNTNPLFVVILTIPHSLGYISN